MPYTVAVHNAMVNASLRGVAFVGWSAVYVALHTANPTDAGSFEVSGGSYARRPVEFAASSGGQASNSALVSWAGLPAVTVTHWSIWSAVTGGTLIAYGTLATARPVVAGDTLVADASSLVVKITQS